MRVAVQLRAPDDGTDIWLVALADTGEYDLLGLFDPAELEATMPMLRERVERETEEGDDDGKLHLRRGLLNRLEHMKREGKLGAGQQE